MPYCHFQIPSLRPLCEIGKSTIVYSTLCNAHRSRFKGASNTSKKKDKFAFRSFYTAPCMEACPIHLDIPRYVEAVKNGQYQEGLNVITQRLPLPGVLGRVCVRPCEFNCRRTLIDEPIQIRHLKRFLADKAKVSNGNCNFIKEFPKNYQQPIKKRPNGIKTAVIGAGPSGLTCDYFLALMGYDVTIFERLSEPGGMAAVGIPDYRLPRDILRDEVKAIEALGVRIVYGKSLGRDFTVEGLQEMSGLIKREIDHLYQFVKGDDRFRNLKIVIEDLLKEKGQDAEIKEQIAMLNAYIKRRGIMEDQRIIDILREIDRLSNALR